MTKYNFSSDLQDAEKRFEMGRGDRFKFEEGPNRFRVLSPGKPVATHRISGKEYHTCYGKENGCPFHGEGAVRDKEGNEIRPSVKFAMWVLDRKDDRIKLAFMPYTIVKGLAALQNDPDYTFEDLPMAYDVTVNATNAGKKEVSYTLLPSPKIVPLTEEELDQLSRQRPIDDVVEKLKSKAQKAAGATIEIDEEE